jgi:hypothetical protein
MIHPAGGQLPVGISAAQGWPPLGRIWCFYLSSISNIIFEIVRLIMELTTSFCQNVSENTLFDLVKVRPTIRQTIIINNVTN